MVAIRMAVGVCALVACGLSIADGQWLNYPTVGMQRTPDGKIDLNAPPPRTPDAKVDLSGIWTRVRSNGPPSIVEGSSDQSRYLLEGSTIDMMPSASETYRKVVAASGLGLPSERCLPKTFPNQILLGIPIQIVQNRGITFMMFEEFNHFRQILTDGRGHPADMNPTWFGYSVGKWDGDTFVVDTRGFRDGLWLDGIGHTATDRLRTIERYERRSIGQLRLQLTVEDPGAYRQPWTVEVQFTLEPDTTLLEFVCENEKFASKRLAPTP